MILNNILLRTSMIRTTLALFTIAALLSACGGGTETIQNPFLGDPSTSRQGPPAATEDVRAFEVNLWSNINSSSRCGGCHINGGNSPAFADPSDVNFAYSQVAPVVDLSSPADSIMVTKVAGGHHCWEDVTQICADALTRMISDWAKTDNSVTTRGVDLEAPEIKAPGTTKTYPQTAQENGSNSFENTIYPLLTEYCSSCHYEEGSIQQQAPFFANPADVDASYAAAKAKINVDTPENSRFVQRLLEAHNCWSDCGSKNETTGTIDGDAGEMLDAIKQFAGAITPTAVDSSLIASMALTMNDGIVASGGERHEANMIARWEFKTRTGATAFDSSGIEPSVNLTLSGNYTWLGSYGINLDGGGARADTHNSKKIHDLVKSSGEYSIEGWVIPANVTQEDANIISYDNGSAQKNFTLSQTLYNYNFHNRTDIADTEAAANGEPILTTEDAGEILQSSLQHVVATYDPVSGRKIYVNGELINVTDPITVSTTLSPWKDTYAFMLGQSAAGSQTWLGQIRMVEIHNRALTQAQITQNYEAGVGEKYFLLFSIEHHIGIPDSFIMFEVSQYDSYSYLFDKPTFINLNPDWTPGGFSIGSLRIAINGKEAVAGQAFANMNATVDNSYDPTSGQLLSTLGAVIALEKGPESDEFFLTFELLADKSHPHVDPIPTAPTPANDAEAVSDIGVRTFDEINEAIARMTNIPITNTAVNDLFITYKQQFPAVETIDAFLASHQMAIAQLALTSCSERVEADALLPTGDVNRRMFTDVDFTTTPDVAFNNTNRDKAIQPVLDAVLLSNLTSSPDQAEVKGLLGDPAPQTLSFEGGSDTYISLISEMSKCPAAPDIPGTPYDPNDPTTGDPHYNENFPCDFNTDIDTPTRTRQIVKALCAAAVGSAAMLIQ